MRRGYIIWIADKGVVNIRVDRANSIASVAFGNKNFPIFTSKVFFNFFDEQLSVLLQIGIFFFFETSRAICFTSILVINLQFLLIFLQVQFWWIYRPACPSVSIPICSWSWYTITKLIYYKVVKKVLLWKSKVHMPMKVYVCRLNEFTKFSTNSLDSKFEKIDDPSFNPDCSI